MAQKIVFALFLLGTLFFSCSRVPITGRRQLSLVSKQNLQLLSYNSYRGFLDTAKVVRDTPEALLVQKVGRRIEKAVQQYMIEAKTPTALNGYKWEYNTVKNGQVNAWCMPGGKVVVYTGILPITQDETGLAVILGHEIAHAVANHGAERMSQQSLANVGSSLAGGILGSMVNGSYATTQVMTQVFGIAAQGTYVKPNSRKHESEADKLGIIFMAMAGYDPQAAVPFWQRMAARTKTKSQLPNWMATHPSDEKRIADLKNYMPKALAYYSMYGTKKP
jgi:predicted Zn-dependent protease